MSQPPRLQEIDYEAVSAFADPSQEIKVTLGELCASYTRETVIMELVELGLIDERAALTLVYFFLRAYSAMLLESKQPKLLARLVGRLTGLEMRAGEAHTLEDIGRRYGLGKQAVSKRLARVAVRLNLPRLTSDKICDAHRLMNRRNHGL